MNTSSSIHMLSRICIVSVLSIVLACSEKLPVAEGIDMAQWQRDEDACSGVREASIKTLEDQKEKFLSLSEMDIVKIFGKPDQNELYKRNQKFYYYFLQPSETCPKPTDNALRLVFRFNAMGLAKEVSIE